MSNALDINMDGTLDTVYMPNSNTGLLIFDKDGDQFSTFVDQNSSRLSLKDHIFSEFLNLEMSKELLHYILFPYLMKIMTI